MVDRVRINYKTLRAINAEAARVAVIEYLSSNNRNISEAAKVFSVQRNVIYSILKKQKTGRLQDSAKAPKKVANKTPKSIEDRIVEIQQIHKFKTKQLWFYLHKFCEIEISYSTLRLILKRNS